MERSLSDNRLSTSFPESLLLRKSIVAMLGLFKFIVFMLSDLLCSSQTTLFFPNLGEKYSISQLIDLGKTLSELSIDAGQWKILKLSNNPRSIARLLWLMASDLDVLVASSSLPSEVLNSVFTKLADDSSGYQSLARVGLLTSGTTGMPKVVVHDSMRVYEKCKLNHQIVYQPRNIVNCLCPLSLSFGHGLIGNFLSSLVSSETCVVIENDIKSLIGIPGLVNQMSIDFMSSVPSMWKVIPINQSNSMQNLTIGVGSSYLSSSLSEKLIHSGIKSLINFYGLTELSNWIGYNEASNDHSSLYDPFGNATFKLYPDVNYRLCTDNPSESTVGELALKHSTMLLGYCGHQYPSTPDNYYLTSDIFKASSEDSCLSMLGRNKFYVKRGGHRIHLTQIDSLISSLNLGIETVTVNAAADYREDANIVTLIESSESSILDSIKNLLKKNINPYSYPNRFALVDELPKTQRGKIDYPSCESIAQNA